MDSNLQKGFLFYPGVYSGIFPFRGKIIGIEICAEHPCKQLQNTAKEMGVILDYHILISNITNTVLQNMAVDTKNKLVFAHCAYNFDSNMTSDEATGVWVKEQENIKKIQTTDHMELIYGPGSYRVFNFKDC